MRLSLQHCSACQLFVTLSLGLRRNHNLTARVPLCTARHSSTHAKGSTRGVSAANPPVSQLSDRQQIQVEQYIDTLLEVNQQFNLTAVRDKEEAYERHVQDSLALLEPIEQGIATQQPLKLIDVGTGAGLPGMLLAIARPHWEVALLDSLRKRCSFMEDVAGALGLQNIKVVWSRAEDAAMPGSLHREAYDVAVARAVAELRVLAELCLPFVAVGGRWIAAKGANCDAEVASARNALGQLGGGVAAAQRVASWAPDGQRTAIVVAKKRATPARYPRQAGTPKRRPL